MVAIAPSLSSWVIRHPSHLSPFPPSPSSLCASSKPRILFLVRAEISSQDDPLQTEQHITIPSSPNNNSPLLPSEDVNYLIKLSLGSVVGAAVIKYGSLLFPDLTRPNVFEASLIVGFPVVVAMVLLAISSLQGKGK